MKEKWTEMPKALQRQVLFRIGGGGLFLLLLLLIMESYRDLYLLLPCILCMFWLLGSALWLFLQAAERNYICLQGPCVHIDTAGFRTRVGAVHLELEPGTVIVPVIYRIRRLSAGHRVGVFVPQTTPVYERDGIYIIGNYYAMEVRR